MQRLGCHPSYSSRAPEALIGFTDAGGTGLLAAGQPHLSVTARPDARPDLETATHIRRLRNHAGPSDRPPTWQVNLLVTFVLQE